MAAAITTGPARSTTRSGRTRLIQIRQAARAARVSRDGRGVKPCASRLKPRPVLVRKSPMLRCEM